MKKSRILFVILFLSSFTAGAQFFYAIGIAAGINYGKEGWSEEQWASQEKYILRLNGAVFAEFFRDSPNYRWRSEFMYNELGTRELVVTSKYSNLTNFISWNNYLLYMHEFYKVVPYVLIGPRVAYLYTRSAQVFGDAIGGMYTIHVSAAAGAGLEFVSYGRVKPFIEFYYNRDIMPSFIGHVGSIDPYPPLKGTAISEVINGHDYELRVGLKFVLKGKSKCPTIDNQADGHYPNNPQ